MSEAFHFRLECSSIAELIWQIAIVVVGYWGFVYRKYNITSHLRYTLILARMLANNLLLSIHLGSLSELNISQSRTYSFAFRSPLKAFSSARLAVAPAQKVPPASTRDFFMSIYGNFDKSTRIGLCRSL